MLLRIPVCVISRAYARFAHNTNSPLKKKNTAPLTLDQVLVGQWRNRFQLPQNTIPEHTSISDQHAHGWTNGCKCISYLNNMALDVKMITASAWNSQKNTCLASYCVGCMIGPILCIQYAHTNLLTIFFYTHTKYMLAFSQLLHM